jgi:TolB-like protein
MDEQAYRIGRLTLVPGRELSGADGPIPLGGRALDLLSVLGERQGGLVLKDELFAAVWNGAIVEENALQAQVSAVRKALGSESARLVTVHGRGYRLKLDTGSVPVAVPAASIAVLAFDNLSGDPQNDYLGDGLAEELIAALSRGPGLKVASRTSSFAYRDRAVDVRTIARELGVATILEGSVRAGGKRLRVTAQLIDAESGFHLWAENFDRPMAGLLEVQEELAAAIARALRGSWQPARTLTAHPEAMRLVLQARAVSRKLTRESLDQAVRLARGAIAIDPGFAKAWESLAGTTFVKANIGFAPSESFAEARELALRAIELDPELGGAFGLLGGVEAAAGRFVEAVAGHRRGMALDPANPVVRENLAMQVLLPTGLIRQAASCADTGIALSPARPQPHTIRGLCALFQGDRESAVAHLDTALLLGQDRSRPPVVVILAEDALKRGEADEAGELLGGLTARELGLPEAREVIALVCHALVSGEGRAAAGDALARLAIAADRSGTLWLHSGNAGLFYYQAQLGMLDAAFHTAGRLVGHWRESGRLATGSLNPMWRTDMAEFRRDPRFHGLVSELGLFRFWARHGPPDGYVLMDGRLVELAD